ncbi:MAG: sporulation protein YtxC [Christensenellales bacterium]|jgi:putative sporulation protein YtxC
MKTYAFKYAGGLPVHKEFAGKLKEAFQGLNFELAEEMCDGLTCLKLKVKDTNETHDGGTDSRAAQFISDAVVDLMMLSKVEEIVERKFPILLTSERTKIIYLALEQMSQHFDSVKWKHCAYKRSLDVLREGREISLDGFQRFRMKEMAAVCEMCVDDSFDKMVIEQEYREFLKLLRYFVETQTPLVEEVHLIGRDGKLELTDENFLPIQKDMLEQLWLDADYIGMSDEDKLISILISIAPSRIHLHGDGGNQKILETIIRVFNGRVVRVDDEIF